MQTSDLGLLSICDRILLRAVPVRLPFLWEVLMQELDLLAGSDT